MPFITEEIWQAIPNDGGMLILQNYPEYTEKLSYPKDEQNFESLMEAIKAVRSRRAEMNVPPSRKAHMIIVTDRRDIFENGRAFILKLAYAGEITVSPDAPANVETMMTLHSAKGLEFDNVFIVGVEEGIFPSIRSIGEPEDMEEERRLCYVGITRAKKKLTLSCARSRMAITTSRSFTPSPTAPALPMRIMLSTSKKLYSS